MCNAHLGESNLDPGLYPSDPQGHTQLVGQTTSWGEVRSLAVLDMGGVVTIAGVEVRDPDVLDRLAERLHQNAASMRRCHARGVKP
jgi:hypothetical protein